MRPLFSTTRLAPGAGLGGGLRPVPGIAPLFFIRRGLSRAYASGSQGGGSSGQEADKGAEGRDKAGEENKVLHRPELEVSALHPLHQAAAAAAHPLLLGSHLFFFLPFPPFLSLLTLL
jgi:hypothetical protein